MSSNIFWVLVTKIKEGELENLRILMSELTESTKANEPEAINYEWFISADEKFCHLFENYTDSSATIVHLKSFFKNYGMRFMSALEIKSFTVYGNPSDELKEMLNPLGVVYMLPFGGFSR